LISRIFNHVAGAGGGARGSTPDLFGRNGLLSLALQGSDVNPGDVSMTFMDSFVSRLSVVTAYVAFAFVGAIVLGVI
jgi:hypothetical protein